MITYVINTSENKTFDSKILFELAGYTKIRWIQCRLDEISKTTEEICEKQNTIGADDFRIAVIVDFYNFDKIRTPYGKKGFSTDVGVDISLYMPYVEIYIQDNLIANLDKKELCPSDLEIYYIQNEKSEHYDVFENADAELRLVLDGDASTEEAEPRYLIEDDEKSAEEPKEKDKKKGAAELCCNEEADPEINEPFYGAFVLYCTSSVSLRFKLDDYPYGQRAMSFTQFSSACRLRWGLTKNDVKRHYFITAYGRGASRLALDTLSLSLYLIHMYEREEQTIEEGELEITHIDPNALKDVLENAWSKVNTAKQIAKKNNTDYLALHQGTFDVTPEDEEVEIPTEMLVLKERSGLPREVIDTKLDAEELYREVDQYASRRSGELQRRNSEEFNKIMYAYLKTRDQTRESDVEEEFASLKEGGFLTTTDRCPSKEEYNALINEKEQEISVLFERALSAEYINVDYSEEKAKADKAIAAYKKAKSCIKINLLADIALAVLVLAAMLIPYGILQLSSFKVSGTEAFILMLQCAGLFFGVLVCAMLLQIVPHFIKMRNAKNTLYNCYLNCAALERYSFSALRRRYEKDLLSIEHDRYEIRQIKRIYSSNLEKDRNISVHRETLERLEDCISSILNNLDVVPPVEYIPSVENEFDINKPIMSRVNRIYKVFSIETIERMFQKKGSEGK